MKTAQLLKTTLILTLFIVGLLFNGCANDNPVALSSNQTANGKEIKFLTLIDQNSNSLSKVTNASTWISKTTGGTLHMHHIADYGSPRPEVTVDLVVAPGAIDYSKTISMTFDDYNSTSIEFGPHGTQFSTPAILNAEAKYFDLTGFDPNSLKFFYVNENGVWEEYPFYQITVNPSTGTIKITGAVIPHFSRYAIGME